MGTKRNVWWIAGGIAGAFVLFAVGAFFSQYSSEESRVDRAVDRIVHEFGFTKTKTERISYQTKGGQITEEFQRSPMDDAATERAIAVLTDASPNLQYDSYLQTQQVQPAELNISGEIEVHRLRLKGESSQWIVQIGLVPSNNDHRLKSPVATLVVISNHKPTLWQKLKAWAMYSV